MTKNTQEQKPLEKRLSNLLRDFDFEVRGNAIYSLPIIRFDSPKYFGSCRDIFDAADRLIALIHNDNYYNRLQQILNQP